MCVYVREGERGSRRQVKTSQQKNSVSEKSYFSRYLSAQSFKYILCKFYVKANIPGILFYFNINNSHGFQIIPIMITLDPAF